MKNALTKKNTLIPFEKMDFEYANMDEVEFAVIDIDPMTRDALKHAQSLARLKTIIQKILVILEMTKTFQLLKS